MAGRTTKLADDCTVSAIGFGAGAALRSLARTWASELRDHAIRVNDQPDAPRRPASIHSPALSASFRWPATLRPRRSRTRRFSWPRT
jgi:hypothetical protein